jgi:Flp pilus assembly protein TadD
MLRFAPRMTAVFLCASALAGCASATPDIASLTGGDTAAGHAKKITAAATVDQTIPTDLDGGVRQAQLMRVAGQYDDAIRVLSQLMLVASDDPRVVSEYGKTLAEKGRAQDAVEFLNRAIELSSNDWTLYSALGVSYDQLGNQTAARAAYEHALALRPNEPSVLNNYALSRMLANDPDSARLLIARAQAAGGASDSKIAANIVMLARLAPAPQAQAAAEKPAPVAQNLPHPITPVAQAVLPAPQQAPPVAAQPSGVVMQAVPFDPYAGPVKPRPPRPKAVASANTDPAKPVAPAAAAKTAAPAAPADAKTADAKAAPAKSDAQAGAQTGVKPDAKTDAKTDSKTDSKAGAKTASKDQVPALRLTADARSP